MYYYPLFNFLLLFFLKMLSNSLKTIRNVSVGSMVEKEKYATQTITNNHLQNDNNNSTPPRAFFLLHKKKCEK